MACDGLSDHDYQLWLLGLLNGPETEHLTTHHRNCCVDCWEDVWHALDFWALYAAALSPDPEHAPSASVRVRLLQHIRRDQPR